MPTWPQGMTAGLVEFSTFAAQSGTFTAVNGSINTITTGASAVTANLPPVAQGGPVSIRKIDSGGTGAVTAKTTDGAQIDGIAGTTGRVVAAGSAVGGATLVSDGTNWWTVC